MATVQKFEKSMIEKFLKSRGLKYLIDQDGDYRVEFAYDPETQCELTIWLLAEGSAHDIYRVLAMSDKRIPKSDWGRAILACNTWNKEKRWPKAFLYVRDPNADPFGFIHLEQQLPLDTGVHQEFLDHMTNMTIMGAHLFWKWAVSEQGL